MALAFVVCLTAGAQAETLILVAPDPELDAAIRAELADARVQILIVDVSEGTPAELALKQREGFMVWHDSGEVVFWDARTGAGSRRPAPKTPAAHADVAKDLRAWMRLETPTTSMAPVAPTERRKRSLTFEAGLVARSNVLDDHRTRLRYSMGVSLGLGPVVLAPAVELGSAMTLPSDRATGDQSAIGLSLHARAGLGPTPSARFEGSAGFSVLRVQMEGADLMGRAIADAATAAALGAAVVGSWRHGRVSIAADLGVDFVLTDQELEDRNVRIGIPRHLEPRAIVRLGIAIR
jgi:hypothetical protein